jgi:hypothetical protein
MLYKGSSLNTTCDDCYKEINDETRHPWFEEDFCLSCGAFKVEAFRKTPCLICGKPIGDEEVMFNDDNDVAHKRCIMQGDDVPDSWHEEDD